MTEHDDSDERVRTVTRLLGALDDIPGEPSEALLPIVYEELRAIARRRMVEEPAGHTLQGTALVHEAFLRLVKDEGARWQNRRHFFAAAAEAMRRILIERARRVSRVKRGVDRRRVDIDEIEVTAEPQSHSLLDLDEALIEFESRFPDKAKIVKLRYFAGLTAAETADVIGVAEITVHKQWRFARAWLLRFLGGAAQ